MSVYVGLSLLIIINSIFVNRIEHAKKIFVFTTMSYLFIIVAFRSYIIGADTLNYVQLFETIGSNTLPQFNINFSTLLGERYEYGFVLLNKVIFDITSDPRWLFIVCAFWTYIMLFVFVIKLSRDPFLSIALFVGLGYFVLSMNALRQSLAIAFVMIAYLFLIRDKILPFILSIILAGMFHKTALLFLIILLIKNVHYRFKTSVFILSCCIIIGLTFEKFFPALTYLNYSNYIDNSSISAGYLGLILNICIIIFLLIISFFAYQNRDIKLWEKYFPNNSDNLLPLIMVISIGIYFISFNLSQFSRIALYFEIASLIYIPNVIQTVESKKIKLFMNVLVYMVLFSYFFIVLICRPEWSQITPYYF